MSLMCRDVDAIPAMDCREFVRVSFGSTEGLRKFDPAGYPNGWQAGFFL